MQNQIYSTTTKSVKINFTRQQLNMSKSILHNNIQTC